MNKFDYVTQLLKEVYELKIKRLEEEVKALTDFSQKIDKAENYERVVLPECLQGRYESLVSDGEFINQEKMYCYCSADLCITNSILKTLEADKEAALKGFSKYLENLQKS